MGSKDLSTWFQIKSSVTLIPPTSLVFALVTIGVGATPILMGGRHNGANSPASTCRTSHIAMRPSLLAKKQFLRMELIRIRCVTNMMETLFPASCVPLTLPLRKPLIEKSLARESLEGGTRPKHRMKSHCARRKVSDATLNESSRFQCRPECLLW